MRYLIFILVLATGLLLCEGAYLLAADESTNYPDAAGREALRLWAERENDRAVAEAIRRYWDYWLSGPSPKYTSQRRWFELEETQKWLKDPKHHKPPPPPTTAWPRDAARLSLLSILLCTLSLDVPSMVSAAVFLPLPTRPRQSQGVKH